MLTIDRYVTRVANRSILAVLIPLLLLISLFSLIEELGERGVTYGLYEASRYVIQTMPRRVDELLVYCLFLGYLVALGRLAESNELTVGRAAGMSPSRIMLALGPSMLLWLLVSIAVSEALAPTSEREAEVDKLQAKYGEDALNRRGGLWLHDGELFMQVKAIGEGGRIFGISQYWLDGERRLTATVTADMGAYDPASRTWTFSDVSRTTMSVTGTSSERMAEWVWENDITPELFASQAFLEPNKMSMLSLRRQIQFAESRGLDGTEYELAFWSRAFKPLTYVGLALFALSVVLGPLRQVGMGLRLTFGIFAGLAFKYLQDLFAPAAVVFAIPATVAILLPIAAFWAVAVVLIRRNA